MKWLMEPGTRRFAVKPLVLLCLALTLVLYAPLLGKDFARSNDTTARFQDPVLESIAGSTLRMLAVTKMSGLWLPLTGISYRLDEALTRLGGPGFRGTHFLLHLACTVLLFSLYRCHTRHLAVAFMATLLFSAHPVQVETLIGLGERRSLLGLLFFLVACRAWMQWIHARCFMQGLTTVMAYLLSLLANPAVIPGCLLFALQAAVERPQAGKGSHGPGKGATLFFLALCFSLSIASTFMNFTPLNPTPENPGNSRTLHAFPGSTILSVPVDTMGHFMILSRPVPVFAGDPPQGPSREKQALSLFLWSALLALIGIQWRRRRRSLFWWAWTGIFLFPTVGWASGFAWPQWHTLYFQLAGLGFLTIRYFHRFFEPMRLFGVQSVFLLIYLIVANVERQKLWEDPHPSQQNLQQGILAPSFYRIPHPHDDTAD